MQETPHLQPLLHRESSVLETEVDGEIVLMSMDAGHCYGLDAVGSEIWRMLKEPSTLHQIQDRCRNRYAGDGARIDSDVEALVMRLRSAHLLKVTGSSSTSE